MKGRQTQDEEVKHQSDGGSTERTTLKDKTTVSKDAHPVGKWIDVRNAYASVESR